MNMFARRILMFFAVAAVALVIAFALFHDAVYRWAALRALDYATGIDAARRTGIVASSERCIWSFVFGRCCAEWCRSRISKFVTWRSSFSPCGVHQRSRHPTMLDSHCR
jgi:hypothetical protein